MTDVDVIKEKAKEVMVEGLDDPNTRRADKGKTWIKTKYPSLDGSKPVIGVSEQPSTVEVAGVNRKHDFKMFETIRVTIMHTDRSYNNKVVKEIINLFSEDTDVDQPDDSKMRGDAGLQYFIPTQVTPVPEDDGVYVHHIDFEAKHDTR